jgi:hypothetical protein
MELQAGQVIVSTPVAPSVVVSGQTVLDPTAATVYGARLPTHHANVLSLILTTTQQVTVAIRRYSAGDSMAQDSTGVVVAGGATGVQVLRASNGDWIGDSAAVIIANASGVDATVSFQLIARS